MSNSIETCFFLEDEPRERIVEFSRDLNTQFEDSWLFNMGRDRLFDYTLEDFLREKKNFHQTRLITGENVPEGKRIRFLLSTGDPSVMMSLVDANDGVYDRVDKLFLKNFGCSLNDYTRKEQNPSY